MYERLDVHKHFYHFGDIGLFRRMYRTERPTVQILVPVLVPFFERNEKI